MKRDDVGGEAAFPQTNNSQDTYRSLFEETPICLWEEDFSAVKQHLDRLRDAGVTDFHEYFQAHPEEVIRCARMVKVRDVNRAALRLFGAKSKEELFQNFDKIFGLEGLKGFRSELIRVAEGKTDSEHEGVNYKLDGQKMDLFVHWSVLSGHEDTYDRVIVSLIDVTERKRVEQQVRLQATALESAANAIMITDAAGKIEWINPSFARLTGRTFRQLVGRNIRDFPNYQRNREIFEQAQEIALSGQVWHTRELVSERVDGAIYYEQMTLAPVHDAQGNVSHLVAVREDITDRKLVELELYWRLRQESLLREVNGLFFDGQNPHILDDLCALLAQFHQIPKVLIARAHPQGMHTEVVAEYPDPAFLAEGDPAISLVNVIPLDRLLGLRTTLVITDVNWDPFLEDVRDFVAESGIRSVLLTPVLQAGQLIGVLELDALEPGVFDEKAIALSETVAQQIGQAMQRDQAERDLREQQEFAQQVMNNMGQGLVVIDRNWLIEYCNGVFADMLGYTPAGLVGQNVLGLVHGLDAAEVSEVTQRWLSGERQVFETKLQHADQASPVYGVVTAVPRYHQGLINGAMAVVTDLTKRKQIELTLASARDQALEASRLKSEFLANMSHEIRTPLNAVIGMADLLLETPLTAEQRDYTQTIHNSSDVLLALINDILDFSKIEAGKMEVEERPFDLRLCVEEALDVVANKASVKNLELAYIFSREIPQHVVGDMVRVRQVLVNLLNNAVKFTEDGEIVLSISLQNQGRNPAAPPQLLFAVRDTGIGIPKTRRDRLFKTFSQVDASTTRRYGGSGLGLAISKHLVELMQGRIGVESEDGHGSTFYFTLPLRVAEEQPQAPVSSDQRHLVGKHILIVDDNATNRLILDRQVQSWGMKTTVFAAGQEALDWLAAGQRCDLAILDMQMPELDGLMLAARIRQMADLPAFPLVMLSSVGQQIGRKEGLFAANLTKPVKQQQLLAVLSDLLGQTAVSPHTSFQPAPAPAESMIDPAFSQTYPLRILLAEDNLINQKVALRILERLGYQADLAANGQEVLEKLDGDTYDLVLMDVQMPVMDGVTATKAIRESWPPARQPQIVAMTANALSQNRQEYLDAGMDDYISKPVRISDLMQALAACYGKLERGD